MGTTIDMTEPMLPPSTEEAAEGITDGSDTIPPWKEQITLRGLVVSALLGCLFCIITHKLNLTVGVIPSLNVAAGLLGFFFVRSWTGILENLGFRVTRFTRQENTVIQTCVVACYGLAFSGELTFLCLDDFSFFFFFFLRLCLFLCFVVGGWGCCWGGGGVVLVVWMLIHCCSNERKENKSTFHFKCSRFWFIDSGS